MDAYGIIYSCDGSEIFENRQHETITQAFESYEAAQTRAYCLIMDGITTRVTLFTLTPTLKIVEDIDAADPQTLADLIAIAIHEQLSTDALDEDGLRCLAAELNDPTETDHDHMRSIALALAKSARKAAINWTIVADLIQRRP